MGETTEVTYFSVFYEAFFDKMEQNRRFFDYYKLTYIEAMELATERADTYLKEAIKRLLLSCCPDVDFNNTDIENKCFNFVATNTEIRLISDLMFEQYYEKGLGKLDPVLNTMTSSDIKMLSNPSTERNSFRNMLNDIKSKNDIAISKYAARDRLTNKRRTIPYDDEV